MYQILVPGWLVALLTFPGVLLHEYAHKKACEAVGLRVYRVAWFRVGRVAGYVIHEPPRSLWQALVVSTAPLFVNTVAEVIVVLVAGVVRPTGLPRYFLIWLAVSFGMHALPSTHDAKVLWVYARRAIRSNPLAIPALLLAGLLYLAALLRIMWVDLLYALAVAATASQVTERLLGYALLTL